MAFQTRISNAAAIAACDAVVDLIDGGAAAGYVEIRSGTQPADVSVAAGGTVLATITLNDPAFGAAVDNTQKATATADVTPEPEDTSADATGTAAWFRAYDSNNTAIMDGQVGTSGTDMIIDNTSITAGQSVKITAWTISMSELET